MIFSRLSPPQPTFEVMTFLSLGTYISMTLFPATWLFFLSFSFVQLDLLGNFDLSNITLSTNLFLVLIEAYHLSIYSDESFKVIEVQVLCAVRISLLSFWINPEKGVCELTYLAAIFQKFSSAPSHLRCLFLVDSHASSWLVKLLLPAPT